MVFLVIADAEFVELVDEVGLVSSQGLFIVEPRDALISNKVDKIHLFLQLKHCFIVSLASLVAALGAITIPLTTHANEQGTHGVEPGVGVLFTLDKRVFNYFSPVLVIRRASLAVIFCVVNILNHDSLHVEGVVSTDTDAEHSHYEGSKTTDE